MNKRFKSIFESFKLCLMIEYLRMSNVLEMVAKVSTRTFIETINLFQ